MSQLMKRLSKKGFTLIELMIVVAIIGILAAVAIPKFADLITKSRESSIKGSLGSVRGAMTIYYSDSEGYYPESATNLLAGLTTESKYLDAFPALTIPKNQNGNAGHPAIAVNVAPSHAAAGNTGTWNYVSTVTGQFIVDCTDVDTKSSTWSTW